MAPSVNKLGLIWAKDLGVFTRLVEGESLSRRGSQGTRRKAAAARLLWVALWLNRAIQICHPERRLAVLCEAQPKDLLAVCNTAPDRTVQPQPLSEFPSRSSRGEEVQSIG